MASDYRCLGVFVTHVKAHGNNAIDLLHQCYGFRPENTRKQDASKTLSSFGTNHSFKMYSCIGNFTYNDMHRCNGLSLSMRTPFVHENIKLSPGGHLYTNDPPFDVGNVEHTDLEDLYPTKFAKKIAERSVKVFNKFFSAVSEPLSNIFWHPFDFSKNVFERSKGILFHCQHVMEYTSKILEMLVDLVTAKCGPYLILMVDESYNVVSCRIVAYEKRKTRQERLERQAAEDEKEQKEYNRKEQQEMGTHKQVDLQNTMEGETSVVKVNQAEGKNINGEKDVNNKENNGNINDKTNK